MTALKAAGKAGRPAGAKDPNLQTRIRRRLRKVYDAVLRNAELGDAACAQLCVDIVLHPERFPDDGRQP